ncbi:type 1 periplasmic binding fold superfamily protein [Muricauda sp. JGD-17]|uniref:Type 1 periplasmic binding fold superfamily protein n=1 Tax=Flagellimonas ochracea TaxID=2696472 RepID=A0A964WWY6_9FLAO|nr:type 1 periplasmic binding fold superfamily protein [Allomuricauda ochracea]NAY91044.1 type 1 periplasmic binding fold superfamily protein [Allomuricauda ochracea]
MKTVNIFSILFLATLLVTGCSEDDNTPEEVNEEETITTLIITLTPAGGGTAITLQSQDLDGDGPNAPVETVSGNLSTSTTYSGSVVVLNETETPAEDITEEVEEEAEEHQFFYVPTGNIAGITYSDQDSDGNPIGIEFELTTGAAGAATLTATLRHEPKKPNDGTLADAGGETDATATFDLTVE